jgi:CBS domain-containing protein
MNVGEICNRDVVFAGEIDTVRQAARRMRQHHVGDLIVVDGSHQPIGILTDRDLVVGALAENEDVDLLRVGDVMTGNPVMVTETDGLDEALETMKRKAIRRLPVVNAEGELTGILTLDDILQVLNNELSKLVQLVIREQKQEALLRRAV